MKAKRTAEKDNIVTIELEDGQTVKLPTASVKATKNDDELFVFAVSRKQAEEDAELARGMINELLS